MEIKDITRGFIQFERIISEIRFTHNTGTYRESDFTKRFERNRDFINELIASGDVQLRALSELFEGMLADIIALGSGEFTADLERKGEKIGRIMEGLVDVQCSI